MLLVPSQMLLYASLGEKLRQYRLKNSIYLRDGGQLSKPEITSSEKRPEAARAAPTAVHVPKSPL